MPYLALIESDGHAHGGLVPELNVSVTGKTPEQVRERLQQGISVATIEYHRAKQDMPLAVYAQAADLPAELRADFPSAAVELLDAAPINPVSMEVERAIDASGLSDSEIARRMGTSPAAVGRLRDYFYWGHSLDALRRLASVVGFVIDLQIFKPLEVPPGTILAYHWGSANIPNQVRIKNDVLELAGRAFPLIVQGDMGTFRLDEPSETMFQNDSETTVYDGAKLR